MKLVQLTVESLMQKLAPAHPQSHHYEEDNHNPGICLRCGWHNIAGRTLSCGHTHYEHAVNELYAFSDLYGNLKLAHTTIRIHLELVDIPKRTMLHLNWKPSNRCPNTSEHTIL